MFDEAAQAQYHTFLMKKRKFHETRDNKSAVCVDHPLTKKIALGTALEILSTHRGAHHRYQLADDEPLNTYNQCPLFLSMTVASCQATPVCKHASRRKENSED